jgi:transcription antitermination factor NusG
MKAELHWYVAQVMTGSEQETARKLTDAGMEALAPVQILHERRHGKWWPTRRVVFPSYVFVRTGMTPRFYYFISGLPRVIRLLGTGRSRYRTSRWKWFVCSLQTAGTSACRRANASTARP